MDIRVIIDDTSLAKQEALIQRMIFMVRQGRPQGRGTPLGLKAQGGWKSTVISSGESPLAGYSIRGGGKSRIIGINGAPFGADNQDTRNQVDDLNYGLMDHHGHAGPALCPMAD